MAGGKMAGRFWVGGKWLGGFWRGENVRGDFGGEISTVSHFKKIWVPGVQVHL